jgi:2-oxoglutarate ferredoxin oxidoreductase subunit beta
MSANQSQAAPAADTKSLSTRAENTWCPGCGNFGLLNAFKRAVLKLESAGIDRSRLLISSGIGCHGKIFDYLALSGLYSIHGREIAAVQGMKLANPALYVVAFGGDGDALGEGISHLVFAAKRNADMAMIVHNNGVYALTTGQVAPTSTRGYKGPSTPQGSVEDALNPLTLMLVAGATFVARGYAGRVEQLADLMARAVKHRGFAFIDVLQPCVTFNNTYQQYNAETEPVTHDPGDFEAALAAARKTDKLRLGLFYETDKPAFDRELLGDWNPVRDRLPRSERLRRIAAALARG